MITPESITRFSIFLVLLAIFGTLELRNPRRRKTMRKSIRWFSNLALASINAITVPLLLPIVALGMAELAQQRGWGLFNVFEAPYLAAFLISFLAFDFVIYSQHRVFHMVPILWRLHRVHHSDVDLDVSSAVRFHVIEIFLSMLIKLATVVVLGPPVLAVLAFEIYLSSASLFHHANLRLPQRLDAFLRWFIVTPDMHRVHHSVVRTETDSNFSFALPWWDYLLGTYCAQPAAGHEGMEVGIEIFRDEKDQQLHRLLAQPFTNGEAPIENEPRAHAEVS